MFSRKIAGLKVIGRTVYCLDGRIPGERYRILENGSLVSELAEVGSGVTIGFGSRVGPDSKVGAGATIGNFCTILDQVTIGPDADIGSRTTILHGVHIGERVVIGCDSHIGSLNRIPPGFRFGQLIVPCEVLHNFDLTPMEASGSVIIVNDHHTVRLIPRL